MYQIDFLPEEYRHRRAACRQQWYRMLVLAMAAGVLVLASFIQHFRKVYLQEQLDLIEPVHSALNAQNQYLNTLQKHLQSARSMAELLCYLEHPWPRTQIVAQLFEPLPHPLMLQQLAIDRQTPENQSPQRPLSRSEQEAEKTRLTAMLPPARDLHRLRQECDPVQTVVRLTGFTLDVEALHHYLAALEKVDLFTKVQLLNLERTGDQEGLRFQVKLVVRPGYGQAGGPKPTQTASRSAETPRSGASSSQRGSSPSGLQTSLHPKTFSSLSISQDSYFPRSASSRSEP